MKKIMTLILAGGLAGVFCLACNKPEILELDPNANCWVFVSTIPGEETILLAKSGLAADKAFAIFDDFKSEYGENNVWWSVDFPGGVNNYEIDRLGIESDTATDCYELTIIIDFSESAVPSINDLLYYGFRGVRINGKMAICKDYFWAYTENGADFSKSFRENSYNYYKGDYGNGTIISSTYKKLGPELEKLPIEF